MSENDAEFANCQKDIHGDDWTGGICTRRSILKAARLKELVVKHRRIRNQHLSGACELSIATTQTAHEDI
jgi:hypothetical protein